MPKIKLKVEEKKKKKSKKSVSEDDDDINLDDYEMLVDDIDNNFENIGNADEYYDPDLDDEKKEDDSAIDGEEKSEKEGNKEEKNDEIVENEKEEESGKDESKEEKSSRKIIIKKVRKNKICENGINENRINEKIDNNSDRDILKMMLVSFEDIRREIRDLKEDIDFLKKEYQKNTIPEYIRVPIKKGEMSLPNDTIELALSYNSDSGDILMFKRYYLKGEEPPIRKSNPRQYEYWNGKKWVRDKDYGKEVIDIIINNIKNCYRSYNTLENVPNGEIFVRNQKYINSMGKKDTYKRKFLKSIMDACIK